MIGRWKCVSVLVLGGVMVLFPAAAWGQYSVVIDRVRTDTDEVFRGADGVGVEFEAHLVNQGCAATTADVTNATLTFQNGVFDVTSEYTVRPYARNPRTMTIDGTHYFFAFWVTVDAAARYGSTAITGVLDTTATVCTQTLPISVLIPDQWFVVNPIKANESSEVYPPDILDVTPDSMGFSVAIGEIDGLPGPEIVVGAPSTWIGSYQSAGAVYVFQGNAGGTYGSANHIFLQPMDAVGGSPDPAAGGNFGWDVAIGDVDGDGINDVVVGEPGYPTFGAVSTGRVQVFFGPTLATSEWVLGGTAYTLGSLFGYSVAVGQLGARIDPNPNKNELIIGAPHGGISINSGEVFIYERRLNPPPSNYFLVSQLQSPNPKMWGLFGLSVATGRLGLGTPSNCDDVIIGAPAEGGINRPWGRVYYSFDWCNTPITTVPLDPVNFDLSAGRFGAVVAAGDVDGNGVDDVVVGDDFREFLPGLNTWAVTLHNPSAAVWTEVRFEEVIQTSDSLGMSLAVGDLDDDGWEDLVVGTPLQDPCGFWTEDAGEVHAILLKDKFGIPGGLPLNKDYRYLFDLHSFAAPPIARDWLGSAVAVGDIDAYPGEEIVVGAPGANLESNHGAGKFIVRTLEP